MAPGSRVSLLISLPALPFTVIVSIWSSPVLEASAPARSTTTRPGAGQCRWHRCRPTTPKQDRLDVIEVYVYGGDVAEEAQACDVRRDVDVSATLVP